MCLNEENMIIIFGNKSIEIKRYKPETIMSHNPQDRGCSREKCDVTPICEICETTQRKSFLMLYNAISVILSI
jgi:hypothetical protein